MNKTNKLKILSRQDDVASLYNKASLVLNLSNKHKFIDGYKTDVQDLEEIEAHIKFLLSDRNRYQQMATNAQKYSQSFREENMISKIAEILK